MLWCRYSEPIPVYSKIEQMNKCAEDNGTGFLLLEKGFADM